MGMENGQGEIIVYQAADGLTRVDVRFEGDTVWLTQAQLVDLYHSSKANISEHIKHILDEGELEENRVVRKFRTTAADGKNYQVMHYNLDMIIAIGYRVRTPVGTQFRQWATARLKEYMAKGFTLDDERLKGNAGGSYWKELLARIRDIRSSEKVMYRQVLDLYATSLDYDPKSPDSVQFFKIVQNKLHYAAHGHTAAEVVYQRADADKPFMGLRTFSGGLPALKDVGIAKNYLDEKELRAMGQIVSGYLDFAERKAERHEPMTMADWSKHLDQILTAGGEQLLKGNGSVSHELAVEKATGEYRKYQQKTLSSVEKAFLDSIKTIEKKTSKNL